MGKENSPIQPQQIAVTAWRPRGRGAPLIEMVMLGREEERRAIAGQWEERRNRVNKEEDSMQVFPHGDLPK